jgi:foldase protein PrsA
MLNANQVSPEDQKALKTFWDGKTGDKDNKTLVKDNCIDQLKELKILLIKAKKDNVVLGKEELDEVKAYIDQFVTENAQGNKEEAEKVVKKQYGITLADYEAIYQSYFLAGKYANDITKKLDVKEDTMKVFYESNAPKFEQVTVKHVLLLTQDQTTGQPMDQAKIDEKKKLADEILAKAKAGENFEALVKQYSEDPGSKEKGGEYTFGKGQMVPEFENWAFTAKDGDYGVVKTTYGYHVMKFIKKAGFEDAKEKVKSELQVEKFNEELEKWKKEDIYDVKINKPIFDAVIVQ